MTNRRRPDRRPAAARRGRPVGGFRLSRRPARLRRGRAGHAHRHPGRGGLPRRRRRLQGAAGDPAAVSRFLDPRQAPRRLRGGNRRQSRQRAWRLSRRDADRAPRRRPGDRRRRRSRRMDDAHAPLRRERDARPVAERGALSPELIRNLAAAIRRSHDRAPLGDGERATRSLATYLDQNQAAFAARPDLFAPRARRGARPREPRRVRRLRPLLIARGERAGCGAATATCTCATSR